MAAADRAPFPERQTKERRESRGEKGADGGVLEERQRGDAASSSLSCRSPNKELTLHRSEEEDRGGGRSRRREREGRQSLAEPRKRQITPRGVGVWLGGGGGVGGGGGGGGGEQGSPVLCAKKEDEGANALEALKKPLRTPKKPERSKSEEI